MSLLGVRIAELDVGRCVLRLAYRPEIAQQHGYFHGAVVGAIADVAGGYAAATLAPAKDDVLTVEYKLSLYAAANGTEIEAVGRVLRAGRLTTSLIDVFDIQADGSRQACAAVLQTVTRVPPATGRATPTAVSDQA